jgi:hypothetical protein
MRILILVFASLFAMLSAASAQVTIETVDTPAIPGTSFEITEDGNLVLATDAGEQTIPLNDIVEIRIGDTDSHTGNSPHKAVLINGEVINGTFSEGDGESLTLLSDSLGKQVIPLGQMDVLILTVSEHRLPAERPDNTTDTIILANKDEDMGGIVDLNPNIVTFDSDILGASRDIELKSVAGIYFTEFESFEEPNDMYAVVALTDGSLVKGALASSADGKLNIQRLGQNDTTEVLMESVASIFFRNGRVLYVSDYDPSDVDEHSFFDPEKTLWPFRKDASVFHGNRISISGTEFRKGLGVHAYSELTFKLPDGTTRFAATVGLDDESEGGGSVIFEVDLDGETRWDSGIMLGGNELAPEGKTGHKGAKTVDIDVTGASTITLRVKSAWGAEIKDRAAWGNARFIR